MPKFEVGQIVQHAIYGNGIITKVTGDDLEIYLEDSPYRDGPFINDSASNGIWESAGKMSDRVPHNSRPKQEYKVNYTYRISFLGGM